MKKAFLAILFPIAFLFFACSEEKQEVPEEQSLEEQMGHPPLKNADALMELAEMPDIDADNPEVKMGDVVLTKPDTWMRERPTSQLRVIQFALKLDTASKVNGFYFGQQDMIDENIDRWKAEFTEVKDFKREKLANGKAVYVMIAGKYQLKAFPMAQEFTETPGYMTLAAIVETAEGPYYFKLVAPEEIAKKEAANFKSFLNSYKTGQAS